MNDAALREALHRASTEAPPAAVDPDLFRRGRRAALRARVAGAAAALACLALVAGLGWRVLQAPPPPVADGQEQAGVPDAIYGPRDGAAPDLPEATFSNGLVPVAASYVDSGITDTVVLVTAGGRYVQADLPDLRDAMLASVGPTLSPDGTHLAYSYAEVGPVGIAVLDLATGDVRRLRVHGDQGVELRTMQWSPGGRKIVWSGQLVTFATESRASFGRAVAGVVDTRTGRATDLPGRGLAWDGAGICDDGTPLRYDPPRFVDDEGSPHLGWRGMDGAHVACTPPTTLVGNSYESLRPVVGWLTRDPGETPWPVVSESRWVDEAAHTSDGRVLRVVEPRGDAAREVGTVEALGAQSLSLASALMAWDQPTVHAGPDPWADAGGWGDQWSAARPWVLGGGVAAVIAVVYRRYRRRT
ncbi:hypothetical protein E8D34_01460 [Nocardioides sp. GY 10113]|uniref:hypothetical protein n=1 Tax=Nocardioides sp. GY 10113 TaxID=2569761 RepID=UPI0010A830BA|nr:hypothetical protein [Nocardioides sp. GY 10113]TIC89192.1 hypothetical protein E8D34_01460 [Nocardioides sp. GY 10113]